MSSVMSNIFKFILTVFLFVNVNTLEIPSYHKPCKFSDPKFQQCAVSIANTFMENYKKGDTTFIDPELKDMKLSFMELTDESEININVSDIHILGYENLKILKIRKVPGKNRLETVVFAKDIILTGDFSVDLILNGKHLAEKGRGTVTLSGVHFKCNFEWKLVEKNGAKYVEVTKSEVSPDIDNVVHEIDGVDNNFLNENWAEVVARILPSAKPSFQRIFHDFTDTIFEEIPYDSLFLE